MAAGTEAFLEILSASCLRSAQGWYDETVGHYRILLSKLCESPIEGLLGAALLDELGFLNTSSNCPGPDDHRIFGTDRGLWQPGHWIWRAALEKAAREGSSAEVLAIVPQCNLGRFRVDFAVAVENVPDLADNGLPLYPTEPKLFVVECDGHDFHERTKGQAARDRSRDRALQGFGATVLRFTGSEIVSDPRGCAGEVGAQVREWVVSYRRRFIPAKAGAV